VLVDLLFKASQCLACSGLLRSNLSSLSLLNTPPVSAPAGFLKLPLIVTEVGLTVAGLRTSKAFAFCEVILIFDVIPANPYAALIKLVQSSFERLLYPIELPFRTKSIIALLA